RSLRSRDLHDFLQRAFGEEFSHPDVAPVIAHAIRLVTASGEADVLFDRTIEIAIRWINENRAQVDKMISLRSLWWIPKAIDRRIASAIMDGVTEVFTSLQKPEGESRAKFRTALAGIVTDLIDSPEQRQQVNNAARRLLAHPDTRAWLTSVWNQLCDA